MTHYDDKKESFQEPILHVDSTPDNEYPLRILRAYRENCNVRWQADGKIDSKIYDVMNEHCEQRAIILDRAIAILETMQDQKIDVVEDIIGEPDEVRGDDY